MTRMAQGQQSPASTFPLEVWIEAVTDDHFHVIDAFGNRSMIPKIMRSKGAAPEVGEHWLMDNSLGQYTLTAILDYAPSGGDASRTFAFFMGGI